MNVRMWDHPSTQRNLNFLADDGVKLVGPNVGEMACGEYGLGRMAEVTDIVSAVKQFFQSGPLLGKHLLVTSGPTHETIDPIRYISNRSSGTQGRAIAAALRDLGAQVSFVTGPTNLATPFGVKTYQVETAKEMLDAVQELLPVDGAVFAAAVADWRLDGVHDQKIKKQTSGALPQLKFLENPDFTFFSNHIRLFTFCPNGQSFNNPLESKLGIFILKSEVHPNGVRLALPEPVTFLPFTCA
jgi:phosphopantothenoylcysteine decarboxylase/phosphopantothenate--cysteine ligase